MKKIIKNKVYDTSTAEMVADWGDNYGSFNRIYEALYRKRTGEYFLHGAGGPRSIYARQVDTNCWTGGEEIRPISYADAMAWAEKYMDTDDYIEHFGPIDEDNSRATIHISISTSAADTLKRAAGMAGLSVSAYVEQLIIKAASDN